MSHRRRAYRWLLVLIPCLGSSCLMSSRSYVVDADGFAVAQGRVLEIENLNSTRQAHLRDGVATMVTEEECRVMMDFGERQERIVLGPGCILVLAERGDFVLHPYDVRYDSRPADAPLAIDVDLRLAEQIILALESLEGAPDAEVLSGRLTELFPNSDASRLFRTFLARRFPVPRKEPVETADMDDRDPQRAQEEFESGKALMEEKKFEEADRVLERAFALDPENQEIEETLVGLLKERGLAFYSKGEWKDAVVCWERVLAIRPHDSEARRFLTRAKSITDKVEN